MPKKNDRALRREDLAKAAFRVIARDGITGATARKVAEEAGCLPGLLTHYVRTMDELLLIAAEHTAAQILKISQDVSGSGTELCNASRSRSFARSTLGQGESRKWLDRPETPSGTFFTSQLRFDV